MPVVVTRCIYWTMSACYPVHLDYTRAGRCDSAIGLCPWLLPGAFIGLGLMMQSDYARVTQCNCTMPVLPAAFIGLYPCYLVHLDYTRVSWCDGAIGLCPCYLLHLDYARVTGAFGLYPQ